VKIKQNYKDYSYEDIHFPQTKELHERGFPYYKTESLQIKHQRKKGGSP
jgi:hypothetical protein